MKNIQCFGPDCKHEIEYACKCTSPETFSCKNHWTEHCDLLNRNHPFESVFIKPIKETKETLIKFLSEVKLKQTNIKNNALALFSQNILNLENSFDGYLKELDFGLFNINQLLEKVSQADKISKFEQESILNLLTLDPNEAIQKCKEIIPGASNLSSNLWFESNQIVEIFIEQLIKSNFEGFLAKLNSIVCTFKEHNTNNAKLEKIKEFVFDLINDIEKTKNEIEDWRETKQKLHEKQLQITKEDLSSADNKQSKTENSHLEINQISTFLYLIDVDEEETTTNLFIYDTNSETQKIIELDTPELLDRGTCITLLPENQLFIFGKGLPTSGISLIIDGNYGIRVLPSGTPCCSSSAIYFDGNVYLFGGKKNDAKWLALSERFDLIRNQWVKLKPMPQADSDCHCILFDGDILISGYRNKKILRYSINNNNFKEIPFEFAEWKRKILTITERLYLIEWGCDGLIYESENRNERAWKIIARSKIINNFSSQVYCAVNNGNIFIGCRFTDGYYKFSLNEKVMMKIVSKYV